VAAPRRLVEEDHGDTSPRVVRLVNAIPTLLLHVCDKAEQDAPMLRRCVENRDYVLQELAGRHDISTDAANKLVLLTLHFGDLPHVKDPKYKAHPFKNRVAKVAAF